MWYPFPTVLKTYFLCNSFPPHCFSAFTNVALDFAPPLPERYTHTLLGQTDSDVHEVVHYPIKIGPKYMG